MKKRIIAFLLALCLICSAVMLVSCNSSGETLMSIGDKTLSVNTYQLLLSRMKGSLEYYGYNVGSESFWNTIVSIDGTTYDDYFRAEILEEAYHYLISDYLFDREGLTLTDERIAEVDELIGAMTDKAGSRTALNSALKEYGMNADLLREVYLLEEKIEMLREHLYGANGEKIAEETKEKYLKDNYVAFGQIFIPGYYYLVDLDEFDNEVYYTSEERRAIAYDKESGSTALDEFGSVITDVFGDPVYYGEDGKIAYDKKNGIRGEVKDKDGNPVTEKYDDETLAKLYSNAEQYAKDCNGDLDRFLEYADLYDSTGSDGEYNYLRSSGTYYSSVGQSVEYLDDIAACAAKLEVGECAVVESEHGYHVIARYEYEDEPYENDEYAEAFADFTDSLIGELYASECEKYKSSVTIDAEVYENAPTMASVASNKLY